MNSGNVSGWQAELALMFEAVQGKTVLRGAPHRGPLVVQRPFYPEGPATCHVYLIHPPGGVVGGDELRVQVVVQPYAHALLTTPAATKFYRSMGPVAVQTQTFTVANGAALEWLPQETIVYPQAQARLTTRLDLAPEARFIGWEMACFGLPASHQPFDAGAFYPALEICRGGQLLLNERGRYLGDQPIMTASWGLAGYPVIGTLVGTSSDRELLATLWTLQPERSDEEQWSVTLVDGLIVCRYIGRTAWRALQYFRQVWALLRPAVLARPACPPRIWRT